MKSLIHKLAHLFGMTKGWPESWHSHDGQYIITGFRCVKCGKISHIHARKN